MCGHHLAPIILLMSLWKMGIRSISSHNRWDTHKHTHRVWVGFEMPTCIQATPATGADRLIVDLPLSLWSHKFSPPVSSTVLYPNTCYSLSLTANSITHLSHVSHSPNFSPPTHCLVPAHNSSRHSLETHRSLWIGKWVGKQQPFSPYISLNTIPQCHPHLCNRPSSLTSPYSLLQFSGD